VKHTASARFWHCLGALPADVQALATKSFALLRQNPSHPSLQFKLLGGSKMYSVRVGLHYRALGLPTAQGRSSVLDRYAWRVRQTRRLMK
jgi:hypothetical protein